MRKIVLPAYERTIIDVVSMSVEQLETLIRIAKVALQEKRPKAPRKAKELKSA